MKTRGFIPYHERLMCEDCIYLKWIGNGSKSQQSTYCTKINPNFIVSLEDICDEFEEKTIK